MSCSGSSDNSANLTNVVDGPNHKEMEKIELIDSLIVEFLRSDYKLSRESKGGAGDCYGIAKEFKNLGGNDLVIDKWDCGDYGYTTNQYYSVGNKLLAIKEFHQEFTGDSLKPYQLTERIYYFNSKSKALVKFRSKTTNSLTDTLFQNSIEYSMITKSLDSLLLEKGVALESSFEKDNLDD